MAFMTRRGLDPYSCDGHGRHRQCRRIVLNDGNRSPSSAVRRWPRPAPGAILIGPSDMMDGLSERFAKRSMRERFRARWASSATRLIRLRLLRPLPRSTRLAPRPTSSKPIPTGQIHLPDGNPAKRPPKPLIEALLDEAGGFPTFLMFKPGLAYLEHSSIDLAPGKNGAADRRLQRSAGEFYAMVEGGPAERGAGSMSERSCFEKPCSAFKRGWGRFSLTYHAC